MNRVYESSIPTADSKRESNPNTMRNGRPAPRRTASGVNPNRPRPPTSIRVCRSAFGRLNAFRQTTSRPNTAPLATSHRPPTINGARLNPRPKWRLFARSWGLVSGVSVEDEPQSLLWALGVENVDDCARVGDTSVTAETPIQAANHRDEFTFASVNDAANKQSAQRATKPFPSAPEEPICSSSSVRCIE